MKSKAVSGMMLTLFIMSILMLVLNAQPVETSGPRYSGWLYRKSHSINNASGAGTNYQIKIKTYYGSGTDSRENVYLNNHSRTDFGDVRFTSSDGSTLLNYWMESKTDSDNAVFWVEVQDNLSSSSATIYVYYGNSDATTTSNGTNTFIFFDDFSTDTLGGVWTGDIDRYSISGGELIEGDYGDGVIKASCSHSDAAVEMKAKIQTGQNEFQEVEGRGDGTYRHYELRLWKSTRNLFKIYYHDSGGETTLWTSFYTPSLNTYYIQSLRMFGTSIEGVLLDLSYSQLKTVDGTNTKASSGTYIRIRGGKTTVDWIRVRKYVYPEPSHGDWGSEEILVPYADIDRAFVSDERADIGSVQTIGFHAKWDNGSSVVGGDIYVNGTKYTTNSSGWIFFNDVSSTVDRKTWIVTGVNCSGVTMYMQTAPNPSIIWDQIKIVDGGVTKESVMVGETATIWFQATYEYDDIIFDDTDGILYVNGSEMSWSTVNRWEYNYIAAVYGSKAFIITEVFDSVYGLTVINDVIGAQTVIVLGEPTLTVSLDSLTTYIGYKVKISGNLTHPDGTGISGANLLLAYSVTGGESWNDITSVTTTAGGEYFVEWMPTATGNYLVRVSWEGNETLYVIGTEVYSTLAVIPVEEKYVFSVISNSTVSELAFNSTSRVLSFTVSGPSGTIGYTKVTIAKTLIGDISKLKVYLDGNQINYTVTSTDDSLVLYLTYQHSTHEVVVSLGPPPFIPPQLITPLSLGILAVALAIAAAILIFRIRKGTP